MQECCQAWNVVGPPVIASAAKAPAAALPVFPSPNKPLPLRAKSPNAVPAMPSPRPVPATPFEAYSFSPLSYTSCVPFLSFLLLP